MNLPPGAGPVLIGMARSLIAEDLGLGKGVPVPDGDWLDEPGASFVTLRIDGELRGCIGSLMAYRPLADDVCGNAVAAAFQDPRFPPLSADEFPQITIEVSVLSNPEPMPFGTKQEALGLLQPGVDGVVLTAHGRRATFLPQVWEELPDREQFIRHLMAKAGLPPDFWDDSVRIERYTVVAFDEPDSTQKA